MNIFLVLVLLLVLAGLISKALYEVPVLASFLFDTESSQLQLFLTWMDPFLRIKVVMKDYKPVVTVFLFQKQIYQRPIQMRRKPGKKPFRYHDLSLSQTQVQVVLGLTDPFEIGIISSILPIVRIYLKKFDISQNFDFFSDHAYVKISGSMKMNVGETVSQMLRSRREGRKSERRDRYGPVQFV